LHTSNPNQSWASVWESAKSDCITRCCKDLGIASELWQPEFIRNWIKENAIQVWCEFKIKGEIKKKPQWRKKNSQPFWNEIKNSESKQTDKKPEPIKDNEPGLKEKALSTAIDLIKSQHTLAEVQMIWSNHKHFQAEKTFMEAKEMMKVALTTKSE
jgi:hypothetical protein